VAVAFGGTLAGAPAGAEVVPGAGQATNYDSDGGGNCSFPAGRTGGLDVALSEVEYGTADACGAFLDVTGPSGTVRVQVTNRCPECAVGHIDLSREAFSQVAPLEAGLVDVTYDLVRDPEVGPISLRVKEGSSQYWMQVQALDHGNPLAGVELQADGGWRSLTRSQDNFWTAEEPGPGPGPYTFRITDVHGQSVTVDGVAMAPNELQPTGARLYGPGAGGGTAAPPPTTAPPTTAAPSTTTVAPTTVPPTTLPPTTLPVTTAPDRAAAARDAAARDGDGGGDEPGDEAAAFAAGLGGGGVRWGTAAGLLVAAGAGAGLAARAARRAREPVLAAGTDAPAPVLPHDGSSAGVSRPR